MILNSVARHVSCFRRGPLCLLLLTDGLEINGWIRPDAAGRLGACSCLHDAGGSSHDQTPAGAPLIFGRRDGVVAAQQAWIEINGRMIAGKKDIGVAAAVIGGGIGAVGIDKKNRFLMMLPSYLPLPIDTAVANVGEEEGLLLPWPEKKVVSSIGCGLDGSEIVVSLPSLGTTWIAQMGARRRGRYCWCRDSEDGDDASWDSSNLKGLAATIFLTGSDWSIVAAEEDDRMTAIVRDEDDGAPF
ncbi:hypothetical protein ACLOJK_008908 [Asimina triloba]